MQDIESSADRPVATALHGAPVSESVVTAAVRPTPEEPRPVVLTASGATFMTARSS